MRRLLVAMTMVVMCSSPVSADPRDDATAGAEADDKTDSFLVDSSQATQHGDGSTPGTSTSGDTEATPPMIGLGNCEQLAEVISDGEWDTAVYCPPVADRAVVTIGMIRTAFTRLKLPAPNLTIQPPDHRTLVNFDTNFYSTTTQQLTHRVRLLGQPVAIRATPSTYTWTFGDNTTITTSHAGAPYPDLLVTHNYLRTATYGVSLAITWTGEYRLGNGTWQQIPGTVATTSPTQHLTAIEAEPKLVAPYGN